MPAVQKNFKIYRQTRNNKYCSSKCSILDKRKYKRNDKICAFCKKIFPFSSKNPPESPIHYYNKSFSLIFCNQNLHQDLQRWGVKPRKSWLELSLPEIPKSLYSHFIRGLYDGDGSFFINKIQKGRYNYLCASLTCASKIFLQEIKALLEEKWKIHFNEIRFDDKGDDKGSYQLRLSSQNDVKTFVQYLYSNAHYFMERKHNFVKNYYGQI